LELIKELYYDARPNKSQDLQMDSLRLRSYLRRPCQITSISVFCLTPCSLVSECGAIQALLPNDSTATYQTTRWHNSLGQANGLHTRLRTCSLPLQPLTK